MSGLARRVKRGRHPRLSGFTIRKHVGRRPPASVDQFTAEQTLFQRKPTARTRNGRRARG